MTDNEQHALDQIRHEITRLKSSDSVYELFGIMRDFCEETLASKRLTDATCKRLIRMQLNIRGAWKENEEKTEKSNLRKESPKSIANLIKNVMLPNHKYDLLSIEDFRDFVIDELELMEEDILPDGITGYNYFRETVKKAINYLLKIGVIDRKSKGLYSVKEREVSREENSVIRWNKNVPSY